MVNWCNSLLWSYLLIWVKASFIEKIQTKLTSSSCFSSPVTSPTKISWAPVTTVPGIANITITGWIRFPGTIRGTKWSDVGTNQAIKFTDTAWPVIWAVSGNSRAKSGNLCFFTRFMLNTAGNVGPCTISLKIRGNNIKQGFPNTLIFLFTFWWSGLNSSWLKIGNFSQF